MATLPSPRTWTVGELLTAAKLNTDLRDGLNFLLGPPRAWLEKVSSGQTIANLIQTSVLFDAEMLDSDNGHSTVTNTSRYTAQTAGWFEATVNVTWDSGAPAVGNRSHWTAKNGSASSTGFQLMVAPTPAGIEVISSFPSMVFLSVGDYVEVRVFQSSGGNMVLAGGSRVFYCWRSVA